MNITEFDKTDIIDVDYLKSIYACIPGIDWFNVTFPYGDTNLVDLINELINQDRYGDLHYLVSMASVNNDAISDKYKWDSIEIQDELHVVNKYTRQTFVVPENITVIHEYAFSGCNSIHKIYIGKNVTSICGSLLENLLKRPLLAHTKICPNNGITIVTTNKYVIKECKKYGVAYEIRNSVKHTL